MFFRVLLLVFIPLSLVTELMTDRTDEEQELQAYVNQIFKNVRKKVKVTTSTTTEKPDKPKVNLNPTIVGKNSPDCNLENGEKGECVAYYLCENKQIISDGTDLLDIRINNKTEGDCDYLDVCCRPPDIVNTTPTEVVSSAAPPTFRECGLRNPEGTGGFRISGFRDATQYGEFPWIVAVLREGDGIWFHKTYIGGGSLISPRVVVTAAHIVKGKVDDGVKMKVRAGEWDTNTKKERFPFQERSVLDTIVHEDFYSGALYNDIALLILDKAISEAPHIGYVCLPKQGQRAEASERCIAAGWGKDQFGSEGEDQVILKKVELPVISNGLCQSAIRRTPFNRQFTLHSSFMCAGGESGKDTCKGDGGAPLVCPLEIREEDEIYRYMQNGIVSWGIGCGQTGKPGVYADVGQFRDWIDSELLARGLDTRTYNY